MELVEVADHAVVTTEGAMAMLGGVGDIFIRVVTPSKHWLPTVSFRTNPKSISVPIYSGVLRRWLCLYHYAACSLPVIVLKISKP